MTQTLSTHFALTEFTRSGAARNASIVNQPSPEVIALAREFCAELLEPIRERFGRIIITSGYRCPALNALMHGVPESDHQWTEERIAADFFTPGADLQSVFDWIRLESSLPFDQVIREHASGRGGDCIHISFRRQPRRIALVGATHNQGGYQRVEVSPVAEARG
ncbi:MAG TPA: D-Ala-D-Ala carboxypeptidase family metallohydrolase [Candidatus Acidoferrales bacterium]|nr:D-Ala-D-Ala carboxypeptidase family metallohydrolase [Candidatus Acidoferrales bacterium]